MALCSCSTFLGTMIVSIIMLMVGSRHLRRDALERG
jgi:hypothetical protein